MSTTDTAPGPSPSAPRAGRRLRRSRSGRVGAGVAAGLGDYFGVDPVLFRVLFATSTFFGGAGILAYLVAWAAIPEDGAEHAPLDDWIAQLRSRNVPPWVVAAAAGLVLWIAAFSWWLPGPFLPVLAVVVLLLITYGRRGASGPAGPAAATGTVVASTSDSQTVDLVKSATTTTATTATWAAGPQPGSAARGWIAQSKAAARERRRRSFPVRMAALLTLAGTLIVLGVVDAVSGIPIPVYPIAGGSIVLAGLLIGLMLRRTPWALLGLLAVCACGLVAFGGTSARLHDGFGKRTWQPAGAPATSYRLAFGQATLDLRDVEAPAAPRTVYVTMAAGQVRVLTPQAVAVTVRTEVRFGNVTVDGRDIGSTDDGGPGFRRTIAAPATVPGPALTVVVRLADGNVAVNRTGRTAE